MSTHHRWLRFFHLAGAIAPVLTLLLLAGITTSAAPSTRVTYTLESVQYDALICPSGTTCDFTSRLSYAGEGSCAGCQPGDPYRVGAFSFNLGVERFFPNDPIRPKSGSGTLTILWTDGSTTVTSFSYKVRDSKSYALTGRVTESGNPQLSTGTVFSGLVGVPPSPIQPAVTSASVSFG